MSATPKPSGAPARSEAPAAGTSRRLLAALVSCAVLWLALLVAAPILRARQQPARASDVGPNSVRGGLVIATAVYLAGAHVCHQRPERSFHIAEQAMPVCGRCTGLYMAGTFGLLASVAAPRRRQRDGRDVSPPTAGRAFGVRWPASLDRRAAWLALAAVPTLGAWTLEIAGLWNPGTPLRAVAALPLGAVAGWFVGRTLRPS